MTILFIFIALSVVSSILVVAAGILSSRINQKENWVELYAQREEFNSEAASPTVD